MKATTLQIAELIDILPEEDVAIVDAFVKKLVHAWDPDFTRVTASERESLEESDAEMKKGEFIPEEEVWL